jgi:hypothetical protein
MASQKGFWDIENRLAELSAEGDPLAPRLIWSHSLDRRRLEFPARLLRDHSLDRPRVEFSGLSHGSGLNALTGFCSRIGGLLPIAPWGRSML